LIGTIFRGKDRCEGFIKFRIGRDNENVWKILINNMLRSRHYSQIRIILLDGFKILPKNYHEIERIYRKMNIPVIAVEQKSIRGVSSKSDTKPNLINKFSRRYYTKDPPEYRIDYGMYSFYSKGLIINDLYAFIKIFFDSKKTPSILNSTREIASAYNIFKMN
jgi:endonuclease V-like protein UPF0215 family